MTSVFFMESQGAPAFCLHACEILAFFLFAPALLGVTRIKAAVVGAVLGAIGMDAVYKKLLEKQA